MNHAIKCRTGNVRDHQQITFATMLNLTPPWPPGPCPPVFLNVQYQQKLNEKYMPFYIVVQVLKLFLIKVYKMQPTVLLFLIVLF